MYSISFNGHWRVCIQVRPFNLHAGEKFSARTRLITNHTIGEFHTHHKPDRSCRSVHSWPEDRLGDGRNWKELTHGYSPRAQFVDVAGYTDPGGFFKPVTTTRVTVYLAVPYAGSSYTTWRRSSAETGSGTPGNPFDATTGEIEFLAPGSYDIKIEDLGIPAKFSTKYVSLDAIPAI